MSQVNTELGYASNAQISLNDAAVRALAGVPSGAISLDNLHGKSNIYPVPSGLIIMSADGSVPSGWARFTGPDGRFIVGAGSSYSAKGTGGSSTPSGTVESSSDGGHTGGAHGYSGYSDFGGGTLSRESTAGAHTHTISISEYTPAKQNMVFIKANGDGLVAPANGMFLAISTLSGFSAFSSDALLAGNSSVGTASLTSTLGSCPSAGNHIHGTTNGYQYGSDWYLCQSSGSHSNHSLSVASITNNFKHKLMRGIYKASQYSLTAGLIAMWEGSSAPAGWTLCNGSNGTPDLRDYFVRIVSSGDGSTGGSSNTISVSVTIGSGGVSHHHTAIAYITSGNSYLLCEGSYTNTHSHTATITPTYTPLYYALTFIQYTG